MYLFKVLFAINSLQIVLGGVEEDEGVKYANKCEGLWLLFIHKVEDFKYLLTTPDRFYFVLLSF